MQYHGGDADMSRVIEFSNALNAAEGGIFNINPLLLLPPVVVIVAVALKVPAIPGITLGIVAGVILGLIFQPGACTLGTIFDYGKNGYYFSDEALAMFEASLSPETSYTMTRLLESGGIMGMMSSVSMTIIAMMFGGIMEETHQLEVIVNALRSLPRACGSRWPDRSDLRSLQRHHARAVHLHRGSRPYVCRGVSQDGRAPGSSVLCP